LPTQGRCCNGNAYTVSTGSTSKLAVAGDDAHDRAFERVGPFVAMIRQRMAQGQALGEQKPAAGPLARLAE
jgi:hypothetical protein